jgi:hypothetical protein
MNRRRFIRTLTGIAATGALAEELLGTRRIFLPPAGGWISALPFKRPSQALFDVLQGMMDDYDRLVAINGIGLAKVYWNQDAGKPMVRIITPEQYRLPA